VKVDVPVDLPARSNSAVMSDSFQTILPFSERDAMPVPRMKAMKRFRLMLAGDFASKVVATFATRIALIGIGLLTTVVVARILGPEGRGLYSVAMAIGVLGLQFGSVGLHTSNTYFVARDRSLLPTLLGNTLVVSWAIGTATILGCYGVFAVWPRIAPLHGSLLFLALLWIPVGLAYLLAQNLLLGLGEIGLFNRTELLNRSLALAAIGWLVMVHKVSAELVFLSGLVMMAAMLGVIIAQLVRLAGAQPRPSFGLFKANLAYGMRAYLATFFCFLVVRSDLLMLKYLRGAETAGYYSIAVSMADYITLLPTVIASLLLPRLSSSHSTWHKFELMKKVVIGSFAIQGPLLMLSALLAPWAVRLLFGTAFAPSVPAYMWLVPGLLFLSVHTVSVQFLNSIGYPMSIVWIWMGCAVLKLMLNAWAIPVYGVSGAAMTSSLCYMLATVLVLMVIRSEVRGGSEKAATPGVAESV
jgi:O-antigen/teichoic acid export membrane protein